MNKPDVNTYASAVAAVLGEQRLMPLGPGSPNLPVKPKLDALTPEALFVRQAIRDKEMARACLAGVWFYHDFLDESHTISQSIESPSGSYWHGILHRREPDFENAKYWFRRVGKHAVFEPLCEAGRELASAEKVPGPARFLATQPAWDPLAFVDLCEACLAGSSPCTLLCRQIQQREWELLFDHCYRHAAGI